MLPRRVDFLGRRFGERGGPSCDNSEMTGDPTNTASSGVTPRESRLRVREMRLSEVGIRIDYFHDSSDDHLRTLGVDRERLPSRTAWHELYEADFARPVQDRDSYLLAWEVDTEIVGFSSTDQITFGEQAFMHLHILETHHRQSGMGTQFVRRSAALYFRVLELQQLYCQPNAFNVAPNRTCQRAGFRYVFTKQLTPSPINFHQPVTRWVLDGPPT
jgi:RimJ/RimL family protein N-acetyltransferase